MINANRKINEIVKDLLTIGSARAVMHVANLTEAPERVEAIYATQIATGWVYIRINWIGPEGARVPVVESILHQGTVCKWSEVNQCLI